MNIDDELYQTILDQPFNDTPRLIYADYLDENGDPERAEFIRLSNELEPYSGNELNHSLLGLNRSERTAKIRRLLDLYYKMSMLDQHRQFNLKLWLHCGPETHRHELMNTLSTGEYHCGFASSIRCSTQYWISNCSHLVNTYPVGRVELKDRNPFVVVQFNNDHYGRWSWAEFTTTLQHSLQNVLPHDIFALLQDGEPAIHDNAKVRWYESKEAADLDLSFACLNRGRIFFNKRPWLCIPMATLSSKQ